MINKTDFYKYKGKVFFNVEDPFGYKHREVEVLAIYENTAAVRDTKTNMTWVVRKNELGLKKTNKSKKFEHFDYRKTKRQWKGKQEQLIDTIRSFIRSDINVPIKTYYSGC